MLIKTFPGGVHPPEFKELTADKPIKKAPLPKRVAIPLIQHTGAPAGPKVKIGDYVKTGEPIAETKALITSTIHASISGTVKAIAMFPHPVIGECEAILIEGDDRDIAYAEPRPRSNVSSLSPDEMREIIRQAGIVGLGGAAFPTHVKLSPPKDKIIDTVLLNGAECEPYLNCDYRLMIEKPAEILKGLKVIMDILNVKKAYIAVEDNKKRAADSLKAALANYETLRSAYEVRITILKTKYPQGSEKQVIKGILKKEVPSLKLPFEIGCVVSNVGTAYAIYEAVYFNKPLYERVITVSGAGVAEPQNLLVRIGTLISDLIDSCGSLAGDVGKVIVGGPMMGIAQYTFDVPVIKGTGGVVVLPRREIDESEESVCIRCGKCIEACPMGLVPTTLMYRVKKERFYEAKELGIMDCFECGACAYVCPAKIPLLDYMKLGKAKAGRR